MYKALSLSEPSLTRQINRQHPNPYFHIMIFNTDSLDDNINYVCELDNFRIIYIVKFTLISI